jgi:MG2 domain
MKAKTSISKTVRLFTFLSLLLLPLFCICQPDITKSSLDKWRTDYPQEKVFLQTDKSFYAANEDVWMKAWCTTIEGPSYLSRILYVDLVDASGKVVQKKMYKLDSLSSANANMMLPTDIKSGNYSINAYTLWMLNFPEFIFSKNIFVYGKEYFSEKKKAKFPKAQLKLQFFPEGGEIISGVENRIAFKATDVFGYPVNIEGQIEDETGNKISTIRTEHDGMGAFEFLAEPGKKYKASVSNGNSASLYFKLPDSKDEGIALKINNSNPNRLFVVLKRGEKNKQLYNELKVVAQLNYQIVNTTMLNIDEGQSALSINKKGLPPGIIQVTVFDKNNLPVAERVAFIENYHLLQPAITQELINNKAKGKNRISFLIDSVTASSVSCLVTSYDSTVKYEDNLAASLLFGTELQGTVFNKGYYVKDKDPVTLRHLDLLMMTQGWRRYDWKKIISNEPIALQYPVESSLSFRGTMYKSDRKEVVTNGKVSFIIRGADSTSILAEAKLTDKGEFMLADIDYKKNAEVAYMGTNNNRDNFVVDVKLKPNYIDSLSVSRYYPKITLDTFGVAANSRLQATASQVRIDKNDSSAFVKYLDNVTVTSKRMSRIDSLNNEYATGVFQMGKSIDPAEYQHYSTIWQMIQVSVPGITVEGNPFDPTVSFNRFGGLGIGSTTTGDESSDLPLSLPLVMQEGGIAFFINEVNVSKDVINSLSTSDVAFIKVLKNEASGLGASQGAIAIYTKTGKDISARSYDKTYTRERHEGYALIKEFYSPDYSLPENKSIKDNRYTLFWSGSIRQAKDKKYRFEFYNNDDGNKMRLVIQGIDADGQLIFKEMVIE